MVTAPGGDPATRKSQSVAVISSDSLINGSFSSISSIESFEICPLGALLHISNQMTLLVNGPIMQMIRVDQIESVFDETTLKQNVNVVVLFSFENEVVC